MFVFKIYYKIRFERGEKLAKDKAWLMDLSDLGNHQDTVGVDYFPIFLIFWFKTPNRKAVGVALNIIDMFCATDLFSLLCIKLSL